MDEYNNGFGTLLVLCIQKETSPTALVVLLEADDSAMERLVD